MNLFILGNICSLVGSTFLLVSTFSRTKKKLIAFQIFDCIFNGLSNLFLGGISGLVVNTLALFRNGLVYLNLSGLVLANVYSLVLLAVSYTVCTSLISWLPVVASIVYCYVICLSKSVTKAKLALISNQVAWFIFNLTIQAYPMLVTNIIIVLTSMYSISRRDVKC